MHLKSKRSIVVTTLVVRCQHTEKLGLPWIAVDIQTAVVCRFGFVRQLDISIIAVLRKLQAAPVTWSRSCARERCPCNIIDAIRREDRRIGIVIQVDSVVICIRERKTIQSQTGPDGIVSQ